MGCLRIMSSIVSPVRNSLSFMVKLRMLLLLPEGHSMQPPLKRVPTSGEGCLVTSFQKLLKMATMEMSPIAIATHRDRRRPLLAEVDTPEKPQIIRASGTIPRTSRRASRHRKHQGRDAFARLGLAQRASKDLGFFRRIDLR